MTSYETMAKPREELPHKTVDFDDTIDDDDDSNLWYVEDQPEFFLI